MTNRQLVEEINRLPLSEKLSIVEIILKDINRESHGDNGLAAAARSLGADYENDNELTAFTSLDSENFYETK